MAEKSAAEALRTGLTLADELALEAERLDGRFLHHTVLRQGLNLQEAMDFFGTDDGGADAG